MSAEWTQSSERVEVEMTNKCDSQMDAGTNFGVLRCALPKGHAGRHKVEFSEHFEWGDNSDITLSQKEVRRRAAFSAATDFIYRDIT